MSKAQFDKVILSINGSDYIVPKDAAMAVFDLFAGHDIYKVHMWYQSNWQDNKQMAIKLESEYMPTIRTLGPVQFATMRANADAKEEHDRAEAAKKASNA